MRCSVTFLAVTLFSSLAYAEESVCGPGISQEIAKRVFHALNHAPLEPECQFEGVGSELTILSATWSIHGKPLPPLRLAARGCLPDANTAAGPFQVRIPTQIAESCPSVESWIKAALHQLEQEDLGPLRASTSDPLFLTSRLLFLGVLFAGILLFASSEIRSTFRRGFGTQGVRTLTLPSFDVAQDRSPTLRRGAGEDGRHAQPTPNPSAPLLHATPARGAAPRERLLAGVAAFVVALALRSALPFSMGNWYAEVLPAQGPPPWMRFGPGFFALQSLLRDVGLWGATALQVSQLVAGAAMLPALAAVLYELRIGRLATAAALTLLATTPFHARLSATSSEHVVAALLCLLLLLAWLRSLRSGSWWWFGIAGCLFPLACFTRVDMSGQATLALLWPLLRDREEGAAVHGKDLWLRCGVMTGIAAVSLLLAYKLIAVPSHHPLPEAWGQWTALRWALAQFWTLATHAPYWMSLTEVMLALLGIVVMAQRRPWLALRVLFTVLLAFVWLGRTFLPDELLAARYFLFTIPIFLIASGYGFETLLHLAPKRAQSWLAAVGIVALGCGNLWSGREAYETRYTFQDEYSFLRQGLSALPDGCVVVQVPIRVNELPRDLDCCLDMPRSPLLLDFPHLRFRALPDDVSDVFAQSPCVVYFEGAACSIADADSTSEGHQPMRRAAAEHVGRRCAEVRRLAQSPPFASTTVSARATTDLFDGQRPAVGLYRLRDQAQ